MEVVVMNDEDILYDVLNHLQITTKVKWFKFFKDSYTNVRLLIRFVNDMILYLEGIVIEYELIFSKEGDRVIRQEKYNYSYIDVEGKKLWSHIDEIYYDITDILYENWRDCVDFKKVSDLLKTEVKLEWTLKEVMKENNVDKRCEKYMNDKIVIDPREIF